MSAAARPDPPGQTGARSSPAPGMPAPQPVAGGVPASSSVATLIARWHVAGRCPSGAEVLEVCCGPDAAQLALFTDRTRQLRRYVGIDERADTVDAARARYAQTAYAAGIGADVGFEQVTLAEPWAGWPPGRFDVAVLTWTLEGRPRRVRRAILEQVARSLPEGALLMLTSALAPAGTAAGDPGSGSAPWSYPELNQCLADAGFVVVDEAGPGVLGVLPPRDPATGRVLDAVTDEHVRQVYGSGAAEELHSQLSATCPPQIYGPVVAGGLGELAGGVLVVAGRTGQDAQDTPAAGRPGGDARERW